MKNENILKTSMERYFKAMQFYSTRPEKSFLKQMSSIFLLIFLGCTLVCLHGCSSQDDSPLGSLQSKNFSKKYNSEYWQDQSKKQTELWKQALQFCQEGTNSDKYKNCFYVQNADLLLPVNEANDPVRTKVNQEMRNIPDFPH